MEHEIHVVEGDVLRLKLDKSLWTIEKDHGSVVYIKCVYNKLNVYADGVTITDYCRSYFTTYRWEKIT